VQDYTRSAIADQVAYRFAEEDDTRSRGPECYHSDPYSYNRSFISWVYMEAI
jgi:hypothetical protein